jgi:hypothetical protein
MWRMWLYYTLKIFVDTCRMIWWYTMTDSHMIIYDDTWCSWSHPHTVCWRPWQKITHTCWIHFDADIWVVVLHCFPRWRASMTELSSEESLFVTRAIWGHKPVNQIVSLVVSSTVTHNAIPQPMISIDFHWFPLVSHWFPIDFPWQPMIPPSFGLEASPSGKWRLTWRILLLQPGPWAWLFRRNWNRSSWSASECARRGTARCRKEDDREKINGKAGHMMWRLWWWWLLYNE